MARKRTTTTTPGLETTETTAPLQEQQDLDGVQQDTVSEGQSPANESEDAATAPKTAANPDAAQQEDTPTVPGSAQNHEQQYVPDPEPEPAPIPAGERPIPYKAAVGVSIAVLHKAVGPGTADMLKPVGSLRQGAAVTVTARNGHYVQLKNGLWMKEAFLTA